LGLGGNVDADDLHKLLKEYDNLKERYPELCKYDWVDDFHNGFASVELDGKRFIINIKGEFVAGS